MDRALLLSRTKSHLLLLNPRKHAHDNKDAARKDRPKVSAQHQAHIVCVGGSHDRRQKHQQDKVPDVPVVLVQRLGPLLAPVQPRCSPHGEADDVLPREDDERRHA